MDTSMAVNILFFIIYIYIFNFARILYKNIPFKYKLLILFKIVYLKNYCLKIYTILFYLIFENFFDSILIREFQDTLE